MWRRGGVFWQSRSEPRTCMVASTWTRNYGSFPVVGDANFQTTFAHLLDDKLAAQQGRVPQIIRIPQLYETRELAKGFTPADCNSFLFTTERYELWKEMDVATKESKPLSGTCLSGPNGVGKSS